jgi:iron-sulfur cluster assembly protein
MIFIDESAKQKINEIKKSENLSDDYFLRVWVTSGGCSGLSYKLDFDNENKVGDEVFEEDGCKVVTDIKSLLYIFDSTLKFSGGLNGKGFFFDNPNATRKCGCGESFAV